MHIRPAQTSECQILTDLSFLSKGYWQYPAEYFHIWRDELTITSEYITNNLVFVAATSDDIVGYYSIIHLPKNIDISNIVLEKGFWLEHMFLLPNYIGKGIGTKMMSHCLDLCSDKGIEQLKVLADPNARKFYQKMKFEYKKEYPSSIPGRTTPLLIRLI